MSNVKRIKIIVFVLLFMIVINYSFAYNQNETETIYTVQLPVNGNYTHSFNVDAGSTLYFDMNNPNSELDFDMVTSYSLNENQSNYTLVVEWEIDGVFASSKNLNAYLNVTSNSSEMSYTIGYEFVVIKSESPIVVLNGTSKLETRNGTFYKIVTVEKLPERSVIPLKITGTPNQEFTLINCSQFLECDEGEKYYYDANGKATVNLDYYVPTNTAIGQYNEHFTIKSPERQDTIEIVFDVKIPDIFVVPLELPEKCYKENQPLEVQTECERLIQEYRLEIIIAYQEYISKVNTEKICSEFVEKEYIVGDTISEVVMNKYNEVLDENKYLREDVEFKTKKIVELESLMQDKETEFERELIQKDSRIQDIKETCHNEKVQINTVTKNYIEEKDNIRRNWYKRFAFFLFIGPLLVLMVKKLSKNRYNYDIAIPDLLLLALTVIGFITMIVIGLAL